ncbi:MAG: DUF6261 family protein [Bacteroidota bacterium]|nr:DUF6261 family protein [Bacteroidota bacterium]
MKTSKIRLADLHNEEHYQFHTEFKDLVEKYGAQPLNIDAAYSAYQPLYIQEGSVLLLIRKSATTEQIVNADNERDIIFRGLADGVKSSLNHFSTDKREAAARLQILLDTFGNVARKSYDEETAAINKLVQEAQNGYTADFALLSLTDWITELNSKNQVFDALMKNRYSEDSAKPDLTMKQIRIDIDVAYRNIADRIDAMLLLNSSKELEVFTQELNTRVDKFASTLAQRKGRAAKDDKEKTPITASNK